MGKTTFIALAVLTLSIWAALVGLLFYKPASPFVDLGGDEVAPAKVAPGGTVTVTRNFRIVRDEPMTVTRAMIFGDCKESCEILDLSTSKLSLTQGEYRKIAREHIIPMLAQPGPWRLVFVVHWQDHFGRELRQPLAELSVEVVK